MRGLPSRWNRGLVTLVMGLTMASAAHGAFVMNVVQTGPNVVASGSGTLNLTDLVLIGTNPVAGAATLPNVGGFIGGPTSTALTDDYNAFSGPMSIGSGGPTREAATSGSGDFVGVVGAAGALVVPSGYVSGASLSDSSTWAGQTFASLGLTAGTYVWTWGTGQNADSFTLNIGVNNNGNGASVPLPAAVWSGSICAGMLAARLRRPRSC